MTHWLTYLRLRGNFATRNKDLKEVKRIARIYYKKYVSTGVKPAGWVLRPVQIACQNVIVGLTALAHDSSIDGLRVPVYLSCEVPHLGTHEANRALSALILCDAFRNGGTMEIRFGSAHREDAVPTGLITLCSQSWNSPWCRG